MECEDISPLLRSGNLGECGRQQIIDVRFDLGGIYTIGEKFTVVIKIIISGDVNRTKQDSV